MIINFVKELQDLSAEANDAANKQRFETYLDSCREEARKGKLSVTFNHGGQYNDKLWSMFINAGFVVQRRGDMTYISWDPNEIEIMRRSRNS